MFFLLFFRVPRAPLCDSSPALCSFWILLSLCSVSSRVLFSFCFFLVCIFLCAVSRPLPLVSFFVKDVSWMSARVLGGVWEERRGEPLLSFFSSDSLCTLLGWTVRALSCVMGVQSLAVRKSVVSVVFLFLLSSLSVLLFFALLPLFCCAVSSCCVVYGLVVLFSFHSSVDPSVRVLLSALLLSFFLFLLMVLLFALCSFPSFLLFFSWSFFSSVALSLAVVCSLVVDVLLLLFSAFSSLLPLVFFVLLSYCPSPNSVTLRCSSLLCSLLSSLPLPLPWILLLFSSLLLFCALSLCPCCCLL